jgi:hypothetical protein
MIHSNRQSLLALLLATTLVAVQTALPWMHVGCQHDHSPAHVSAAACGHHHCHGHRHQTESQPSDSAPTLDQSQHCPLSDDCAACRFLLLSAAASDPASVWLVEHVSLLSAPLPSAAAASQPSGLYRSRAPPALS